MDLMRQRRQNSSYMKKKQLSLHDKAMLAMREAVRGVIERHKSVEFCSLPLLLLGKNCSTGRLKDVKADTC